MRTVYLAQTAVKTAQQDSLPLASGCWADERLISIPAFLSHMIHVEGFIIWINGTLKRKYQVPSVKTQQFPVFSLSFFNVVPRSKLRKLTA